MAEAVPVAEAGTVCAIRVLGKVIYWLAVLAISVALLVALVLYFESQDESTLDSGATAPLPFA